MKLPLKNKRRKPNITTFGFTLIELLAVILLLTIIALIAVPQVLHIIDNARKKSFENSAYGLLKTAKLYYSRKDLLGEFIDEKIFEFPNNIEGLEFDGKIPSSGIIVIDIDGNIAISISDGKYCAVKEFQDRNITILSNCYSEENEPEQNEPEQNEEQMPPIEIPPEILGDVSAPELKTGMIPVNIANDGTVTKADTESGWYDYAEKKWANAITVSSTTRSNYLNASPGTTIQVNDILAYFVWIPRYKYKLWYTNTTSMISGADINKVHSIEIIFQDKNTTKADGDENGEYLTHPAFTFGEEEINGFWVGKFETGYAIATSKETAQVPTANSSMVVIKPNTFAWWGMDVSNIFNTIKGMNATGNIFGLNSTSDSHLMKNIEWGAVAYLSHSVYGKNGEVYLNNNTSYKTGCGGNSASPFPTTSCQNQYGQKSNGVYNQSTTGNISGIFDMSGGAWEYVMGYNTLENIPYENGGFTASTFPEDKYVDKYNSIYYSQYSQRKLGDATGEMGPFNSIQQNGSWYRDVALFVDKTAPWFVRGGAYSLNYNSASGIFSFGNDGLLSEIAFRAVIS